MHALISIVVPAYTWQCTSGVVYAHFSGLYPVRTHLTATTQMFVAIVPVTPALAKHYVYGWDKAHY